MFETNEWRKVGSNDYIDPQLIFCYRKIYVTRNENKVNRRVCSYPLSNCLRGIDCEPNAANRNKSWERSQESQGEAYEALSNCHYSTKIIGLALMSSLKMHGRIDWLQKARALLFYSSSRKRKTKNEKMLQTTTPRTTFHSKSIPGRN